MQFENVIDTINRTEATKLLGNIQFQASRAGLDDISLDEINNEIKEYRKSKANRRNRQNF